MNPLIYASLNETIALKSFYIAEGKANILKRFGVGNQLIDNDNVKIKFMPVQAVRCFIFNQDVEPSEGVDEDVKL